MNPSGSSTKPSQKDPSSGLKIVFVGSNGLRAGWRLLIFLVLLVTLLAGASLLAGVVSQLGAQNGQAAFRAFGQGALTPTLLSISEAILFLILCVATWIMSKVEHRGFGEYGLPPHQAFGRNFWIGSLAGFLAISGTLLTMFFFGGFRITGLSLHGVTILSSFLVWGVAFVIVGLFEEFTFRGYGQYTLASGIGFWPAAFVISGLFGFAHRGNPGENAVGDFAVVLFGLLLCLFLRRTGNLWWGVGFHAGYDWGQSFFYGVPDSGVLPYHNLFSSSFSGPRWLTGGTVGPEASVLTPLALLVVALIFSRCHRESRH
jgi:CAAX protease family protein